jgi:hypothetical protein
MEENQLQTEHLIAAPIPVKESAFFSLQKMLLRNTTT